MTIGLLDNIEGDLKDVLGKSGGASNLIAQAFNDVGGLQGAVDMLRKSGLGDRVDSWLSTHASNLPVTPEEISAALGNEQLQQLAAKFGVPLDQVASILSQHLPAAVDKASPQGKLEQ